MEQQLRNLEQEIQTIQQRNARVEVDKAWETSIFRKVSIALLTYIVVVLFFYIAGIGRPFINAIVPTTGFVLSTLSLSVLKRLWIEHRDRQSKS